MRPVGVVLVLLNASVFSLWVATGFAQSFTPATITTYAGPPSPADGGPVITQGFDQPMSVIADGAGGFYFGSSGQHRIYRVNSEGALRVIAGNGTAGFSGDGGPATSAQLSTPRGFALDAAGSLFFSDIQRVRKVTADGIITTVAGTGTPGFSGDGGPATSAQLAIPDGLAVDSAGHLFIADGGNRRVRRVSPDGTITTHAGGGTGGDGEAATSAMLGEPRDVAVDNNGNLFIVDFSPARIRKVATDGIITTVAGGGRGDGEGVQATSVSLVGPVAVAVDAAGNLFIVEAARCRIRKVTADGIITTIAGNFIGFIGDGGPATAAYFKIPLDVAVDTTGNIFIADTSNDRIRKISAAGIINTAAGPGVGGIGDGGPATGAQFNSPSSVAVDSAGNLFVADTLNHRIRKVSPDGAITTVAGSGINPGFSGDGGAATAAQLTEPRGVAVDVAGNLFIADTGNFRVRRVTTNGIITTVAGNGTVGFGGNGGPATSAQLDFPSGVAVDGAGNLFIADFNNGRIYKVTVDGIMTSVAGGGGSGLGDSGEATTAQLNHPSGVLVDPMGNLFIADTLNNRIRKVATDGTISTVAGTGEGSFGGDDGSAVSGQLQSPRGIAMDAAGNLFIADQLNNRIRKVTPDGIISTVAGTGVGGFSGDAGPAAAAQLNSPSSVAVDAAGNLFVADTSNLRIRKVIFRQSVSFSISNHAGTSVTSAGTSRASVTGYGRIQANPGSTTPSGVAIYRYRPGSYLVSETAVPATATLSSGRIYAEVNGRVNTGLAIANPNNQTATIHFFYTDTLGNDLGSGSTTLGANRQIAQFLNAAPFKTFTGATFEGTFSFTSDVPVGAMAIRGLSNERGDFLMSTLPVVDPMVAPARATVVIPHFADGGGWTTQILLINSTNNAMTGSVEFRDDSGAIVNAQIDGQTTSAYAIPPQSSQKLATIGASSTTTTGSVRILPTSSPFSDGSAPTPLLVFSYHPGATTLTEAGVQAATGTAFRMYAESSGNIQAGIGVTNNSASPASVTFELFNLDGSTTGLPQPAILHLNAFGHASKFLADIFQNQALPNPFKGVVRISTISSPGISVTALRTNTNERGDFLISTTPVTNEAAPASPSELLFPQVADGGGYTTQFVLFSGRAGQASSGTMELYSSSGFALDVLLR